jgi:hypothetical protein
MPGRPMKAYVVLPPQVAAAKEARRAWLAAGVAATAKLPPKAKKPAKKARANP